jgi:anti-anti-sigma factor
MGEGRVLYADQDHVHVLRYVGDIRHPLAPSVGRFVDTLLERFADEELVVDLSEVDTIDSTNLGEIARIAIVLAERNGKRPAIVSTRYEINQILHSMALDEVFDLRTECAAKGDGEPIPAIAVTKELSLRVILAAHRRLMQMSEENRKKFAQVVDLLEMELRDMSKGVS